MSYDIYGLWAGQCVNITDTVCFYYPAWLENSCATLNFCMIENTFQDTSAFDGVLGLGRVSQNQSGSSNTSFVF